MATPLFDLVLILSASLFNHQSVRRSGTFRGHSKVLFGAVEKAIYVFAARFCGGEPPNLLVWRCQEDLQLVAVATSCLLTPIGRAPTRLVSPADGPRWEGAKLLEESFSDDDLEEVSDCLGVLDRNIVPLHCGHQRNQECLNDVGLDSARLPL